MKLRTVLTLLALALAISLAACGDDDEGDGGGGQADTSAEPAQVDFTGTDTTVEAPESVTPGVVEITFQNDAKKPRSIQLIKVEGDHPEKEVIKTYDGAGEGGKIPDWLLAGGGVAPAPPGASSTATQELEEGLYYAFSETDGPGKTLHTTFEVSGEAGDAELPEAQKVTGSEYTFENETLTAGEPIAFENVGQEPHHLIAAPLKKGTTLKDVEQFFKTEKGPPPIDFEAITGTAVIDTDQTVVSDLELKKGRYAFVCFISDRQGGPPHVVKGMLTEATVE